MESLKSENKDDVKKNVDLMQKMLSGDKKILDKSTLDLDVRYDQLMGEKGKILDSKELVENKLSDIEGKQGQLDQKGSYLTLERRSLDDIQKNDVDLMQLKDQRDTLDVNKVEERYQELLQERFGDQENALAIKQQQLESEKLSLDQERSNYAEQLTQHQQEVESYQNSLKEFEENRNLVQQQYELHEEQQRVVDGGISKYEIEDGLNRTQEQIDQTVGLFQEKQAELSNSQTQLEEVREVYNQDLEFQTQEYSKYSEDMTRAQEEVANTQFVYDQQKSEIDDYTSSVQDKWRSDDLYLEPQSQQVVPDVQQLQEEHTETAMEKIMKIQEESKIYEEKMDRMKKIEE